MKGFLSKMKYLKEKQKKGGKKLGCSPYLWPGKYEKKYLISVNLAHTNPSLISLGNESND